VAYTLQAPRNMIPHRPFPIGGPLEPATNPLSQTVTEIFNGKCDVMVDNDMTLNDL